MTDSAAVGFSTWKSFSAGWKIALLGSFLALLTGLSVYNFEGKIQSREFPGQEALVQEYTPWGKQTVTSIGNQLNAYGEVKKSLKAGGVFSFSLSGSRLRTALPWQAEP